jgi:SAM-dependent methyltransferase
MYLLEFPICKDCGFVFLDFAYSNDYNELAEDYYNTATWDNTSDMKPEKFKIILKMLKKVFKTNEAINVLEIGSGRGGLLLHIKKEFPLSNTIGVDPNTTTSNVPTLKKFFSASDFANKFDVVLMQQMFEHFVNPIDFLISLKNLLTEKGVICCEVPYLLNNMENFSEDFSFEHVNYFTLRTINLISEKTGFILKDIDSSVFLTFLFSNYGSKIRIKEENINYTEELIENFAKNKDKLIKKLVRNFSDYPVIFYGTGYNFVKIFQEISSILKPKEIFYFDDFYTEHREKFFNLKRMEKFKKTPLIILSSGVFKTKEIIINKIKKKEIKCFLLDPWKELYDFTKFKNKELI